MLPSWRSDPWQVALAKGWHAAELIRQEWGEADFWKVWQGTTRDGPLASFKELLQHIKLEASFAASAEGTGRARRSGHDASLMLTRALQRTDLEWEGRHRSRLRGAAGIDVRLTRQIVQKLPAGGPREALGSVLVGDMVVRHLTKHWQPHGGRCL